MAQEYGKLDLEVVFRVSHENVQDLEGFSRVLGESMG